MGVEQLALADDALVEGGVDFILVETVFDTLNAKAAIVAVIVVNAFFSFAQEYRAERAVEALAIEEQEEEERDEETEPAGRGQG